MWYKIITNIIVLNFRLHVIFDNHVTKKKFFTGKVNSLFGVAEAMMPLVYAPMYTSVYTATIKTFPGAFFLLGGGLTVPAVLIFM